MEKMTPRNALQLLDEAVSQISSTRSLHVRLQQAVDVISLSLARLDALEDETVDRSTEDRSKKSQS